MEVDAWSVGCVFGELLGHGAPLFQGRAGDSNQIDQIGTRLGAFDDAAKAAFVRLGAQMDALDAWQARFRARDAPSPRRWAQLRADLEGTDELRLLNALLDWNPITRCRVAAAARARCLRCDDEGGVGNGEDVVVVDHVVDDVDNVVDDVVDKDVDVDVDSCRTGGKCSVGTPREPRLLSGASLRAQLRVEIDAARGRRGKAPAVEGGRSTTRGRCVRRALS